MKRLILIQLVVLICGTLFAWYNFTREMIDYLNARACTLGCADAGTNPFLTPCFGGAVFFTLALVLSILIFLKSRKEMQ